MTDEIHRPIALPVLCRMVDGLANAVAARIPTTGASDCQVHVVDISREAAVCLPGLRDRLVVAFVPTGAGGVIADAARARAAGRAGSACMPEAGHVVAICLVDSTPTDAVSTTVGLGALAEALAAALDLCMTREGNSSTKALARPQVAAAAVALAGALRVGRVSAFETVDRIMAADTVLREVSSGYAGFDDAAQADCIDAILAIAFDQ